MSKLYYKDNEKGSYSSSSSSRKHQRSRTRSRSRSRSRSSSYSPPRSKEYKKSYSDRKDDSKQKYESSSESENELPPPPPPPIISKVSFGMKVPVTKPTLSSGIQMKLTTNKTTDPKKLKVASAFADDSSDDEVEEMPAECRMRMRNIGRDTPTSSGPNSFGKTKQGFCDSNKIFERSFKKYYSDDC